MWFNNPFPNAIHDPLIYIQNKGYARLLHSFLGPRLIGPFKGTIGDVYGTLGEALDPSKLFILIVFVSFRCVEPLGNMLARIVSSSHFGKRLRAGDMTIFSSICVFVVFLGVYTAWEVSHLFCRQISCGMPLESCLGTPWAPRHDHICKNKYFYRDLSGYQRRI